jgi:hypothetical protein
VSECQGSSLSRECYRNARTGFGFCSRLNPDSPALFTGGGFHGSRRTRPPLVFSHLEPTSTNESGACAGCVSIPFHGGLDQSHQDHLSHDPGRILEDDRRSEVGGEGQEDQLLSQMESLTVSSEDLTTRVRFAEDSVDHDSQQQTDSYSGDCVASDIHSQWAWSRGGHGNGGSCRDEALGVGYVDDVTVDDLTGYFDQMLHLPRPMSEMAQLMYT